MIDKAVVQKRRSRMISRMTCWLSCVDTTNMKMKLSNIFLSLLVVCIVLIPGVSRGQDNAFSIYLEPEHKIVYPPSVGDTFTLDVMIDSLDAGEYVYNLLFAIDYDADVINIEAPRLSPPYPTGDIKEHFANFSTSTSFMSQMGVHLHIPTPEHILNPPADSVFDGRNNVVRFIFGANASREPGGVIGETEFPFQVSAPLPASLMTITFTVKSDNPADWTPLLFVLGSKTEASDRDGNKFTLNLIGGDVRLPVKLVALGAIWHPDGNKIFWEAESQQENLGWNIYQSESKDGKFVKINGELIKGAGTTPNPMKYSFIDRDAERGKSYFYYLEDISFNGEKHRTPLIKTILANTVTSWGAIKRSVLR